MALSNEDVQKHAEGHVRANAFRVILCCKVLDGLSEHDLKTLIPGYDIWLEEYTRQVAAGEGGDFPDPGNIRLEQITHLIDALNALSKIS